MENRFIDLETRVAFQDEAIDSLTRTVVDLRQQLDRVGKELDQLRELIKEAAPALVGPKEQEPPPPHY